MCIERQSYDWMLAVLSDLMNDIVDKWMAEKDKIQLIWIIIYAGQLGWSTMAESGWKMISGQELSRSSNMNLNNCFAYSKTNMAKQHVENCLPHFWEHMWRKYDIVLLTKYWIST